tara:strand:+ start:1169 stop:1387 length:219 start_codon:yes stop_codon:yes gene_type:complete
MAKAKFISKFELDVIRIGVSRGFNAPQIGRFIGRNKLTVYNHIAAMKEAGTIGDVPMAFVVDEIAEAIRAKG